MPFRSWRAPIHHTFWFSRFSPEGEEVSHAQQLSSRASPCETRVPACNFLLTLGPGSPLRPGRYDKPDFPAAKFFRFPATNTREDPIANLRCVCYKTFRKERGPRRPNHRRRCFCASQKYGFIRGYNRLQVLVRDNNVDQALKALKKKLQREGVFREMKLRGHFEKPSEKRAREKAEAIRRARKLARKKLQREGLLPSKPAAARGAGGKGPGAGRPSAGGGAGFSSGGGFRSGGSQGGAA